jgi:hypothetical protein
MTTTDQVRVKALTLAEADTPTTEAVRELMDCCGGKRVPVVLARQTFQMHLEETEHVDPVVNRAADLLDQLLAKMPLD